MPNEKLCQRFADCIEVVAGIFLSPEHNVTDHAAVAFQKNVAGAEWNKDPGSIVFQHNVALHRENRVAISAVGPAVEQGQICEVMVWAVRGLIEVR